MKIVELGEVATIQIGGTPARARSEYWAEKGSGHTWLAISDLTQKYIFDSKEQITQMGVENSSVKLVPAETVLMSFKLSVGKVAIAGTDLYTNEAIAAFILDDTRVDRDFLFHFLPFFVTKVKAKQAVKGLTLNKKSLAKIPLALPSIENQRALAIELNNVDEIETIATQTLNAVGRTKLALMQHYLGDIGAQD